MTRTAEGRAGRLGGRKRREEEKAIPIRRGMCVYAIWRRGKQNRFLLQRDVTAATMPYWLASPERQLRARRILRRCRRRRDIGLSDPFACGARRRRKSCGLSRGRADVKARSLVPPWSLPNGARCFHREINAAAAFLSVAVRDNLGGASVAKSRVIYLSSSSPGLRRQQSRFLSQRDKLFRKEKSLLNRRSFSSRLLCVLPSIVFPFTKGCMVQ